MFDMVERPGKLAPLGRDHAEQKMPIGMGRCKLQQLCASAFCTVQIPAAQMPLGIPMQAINVRSVDDRLVYSPNR